MRVRLFSDIGHVMTKADEKLKRACTLSTYDDVQKGKTCDHGTSPRYLLGTKSALFILFCLRK